MQALLQENEHLDGVVRMFVGTPRHVDIINHTVDTVDSIQSSDPEATIKAFVVPIPKDKVRAELIRRVIIERINEAVTDEFMAPEEFN